MRGTDEIKKISILYISPHGNTELMANAVASGAMVKGVEVNSHHISNLCDSEIRAIVEGADALVFGIPTVARNIPKQMWDLLGYLGTIELKATVSALFGSYGWSGEVSRMAEERLKGAGLRLVGNAVRTTVLDQCPALGRIVAEEVMREG